VELQIPEIVDTEGCPITMERFREAINQVITDLDEEMKAPNPMISEEELTLIQEMSIPTVKVSLGNNETTIPLQDNSIEREQAAKQTRQQIEAHDVRREAETAAQNRFIKRKRKGELPQVTKQELFEIRRIAREYGEKRKKAKLEHERHQKEALEKQKAQREEDYRKKEARLLKLVKKKEKKANQSWERVRKLEEELKENWSQMASANPDNFDSELPNRWLNKRLTDGNIPSTSRIQPPSPINIPSSERWDEIESSPKQTGQKRPGCLRSSEPKPSQPATRREAIPVGRGTP